MDTIHTKYCRMEENRMESTKVLTTIQEFWVGGETAERSLPELYKNPVHAAKGQQVYMSSHHQP